jgi:class 3 adenylate cyclase
MDVRSALEAVQAPTLVLHGSNDHVCPRSHAEYLAGRIPSARIVELDGCDHIPWFGDQEKVLTAIEEFVLGESAASEPDRVLATVLFTDIVDSTASVAANGDQVWLRLLDDHDHVVRREVLSAGGRLIKSTGDGWLATFDRPGRAIAAAAAMRGALAAMGLHIRAGIHTGEIELRHDDVGGIGVHLAARVCGTAASGEVLVSRTVSDLVAGSAIQFLDRGEHELKGIPGRWQLLALAPG